MTNHDLNSFYKGRRVYITGITGDTGTWLALKLKSMGAIVSGIGLVPDSNSTAYTNNLEAEVSIVYGDITEDADKSVYLASIVHFKPEIVFHLAAQTPNWSDYSDIYSVFNTNIMGTVITHEILRGLGSKVSLVNIREQMPSVNEIDRFSTVVSSSITECYQGEVKSKVTSSVIMKPEGDFKGEEGKELVKSTINSAIEAGMNQYINECP